MSNNTPTAPGWWYKSNGAEEEEISCLFVTMYGHRLHYVRQGLLPVTDDGLWRGPVPMPGVWVYADERGAPTYAEYRDDERGEQEATQ